MEDISKAIRRALVGRGWTVEGEKNGVIESRIRVRAHKANITITFDKESISIKYVSSDNLLYKEEGGTKYIHHNYNRWIRYLEQDVFRNLISR